MEEEELIHQCLANSRKAQLRLYNQYCDGMFVVACRYLKDQDQAEDALQEAFIKAFKSLEQFSFNVSFGAWLKKIVIHQCLDELKKKQYQRLEDDVLVVELHEEDHWEVVDAISGAQIKSTIDSLDDPYGTVLKLYLLEGYDHQEIASILGVTQTASRTYLFRGKNKVKSKLKEFRNGTGS